MKIYKYAIVALFIAGIHSCHEDVLGPTLKDQKAPGIVTGVEIENVNGGAVLKYNIPQDEDLLYVSAQFELNGKMSETRASFYNNELKIEGFGDTLSHRVSLYAVDKSENYSAPVTVTINPLEPAVIATSKTVKIEPAFGGAKFTWANATESALTYYLMSEDSLGEMVIVNTIYSSQLDGLGYLRGYKSVERPFALLIRDRWMNYSDTIFPQEGRYIIPKFEEKVDKSKFRKLILAGDQNWSVWGGQYEAAYDDDVLTKAHTQSGKGWPHVYSIDLGVKVKLSRYKMWQRQDVPSLQAYAHGNVRRWEVYGTAETPAEDGSLDNWTKLRECTIEKPSGLPVNQNSEEDLILLRQGHEFEISEDAPYVRYLRFVVLETWGQTDFTYLAEFNLFGDIVEL
ncbi:DUF5000 domain-containing lipoprotein [Sunxiuqinia sp. sy24]|uniref:DUF5000 domain-containing lipoprotein n=1 Tax=Sunxiuqinia sp. sy24 TaxID=3461495 RepID=UPI004045E091